LPSQGHGLILRTAYFFEYYTATDDWKCRYSRGTCTYACRTKQGRKKHMPYGELVGTTMYNVTDGVSQ